jgi:hypothetical protein
MAIWAFDLTMVETYLGSVAASQKLIFVDP